LQRISAVGGQFPEQLAPKKRVLAPVSPSQSKAPLTVSR